jgi:hypothetical protein
LSTQRQPVPGGSSGPAYPAQSLAAQVHRYEPDWRYALGGRAASFRPGGLRQRGLRMITGQLTDTDFIEFQRLHWQFPKGCGCILFCLYFMTFLLLVSLFSVKETYQMVNLLFYFPILLVAVFIPIFWYVLLPRQWSHVFYQNKELVLPFTIALERDCLIFTNELGHTKRPWKFFIKWKENAKMMALYQADNLATILPKRIFSDDDISFIHARLSENNISKKPIQSKIQKFIRWCFIVLVVIIFLAYLMYSCMATTSL